MLRQGSGPPLVLLHGITGSDAIWRRVMPLLAPHHDTIAFSALGHRDGTRAARGTRIADVVDDAERRLDELALARPHLAGNSMGGWVALELARRGRAASVCALSPAGCWDAAAGDQGRATRRLRQLVALTRRTRPLLPLAARVSVVRRLAMRDNAVHGERLTPAELVDLADGLIACTVAEDILGTDEQLAPLDPPPCPITLAWAERDRILPLAADGARARRLFPGAQWRVLPGVGHVPMIDDAALVADTILAAARRAAG